MKINPVFLTILIAIAAFGLSVKIFTCNMRQYATLPTHLNLHVLDDSLGYYKTFNLEVKSLLPLDTVKYPHNYRGVPFRKEVIYHQNPAFMVWIIFVCSMFAFAAGSVPLFVKRAIDLNMRFRFSNKQIWSGILLAVVVLLFLAVRRTEVRGYYYTPDIIDNFKILLKNGYILKCIELITSALVCPTLVVIFFTGIAAHKINSNEDVHEEASEAKVKLKAEHLRVLSSGLLGALQVLSIIIVFSVLTSTALGKSIRASVHVDGFDLYPPEISFVYGMIFSVFLCIIYIPIHLYLREQYRDLKHTASKLQFVDKSIKKEFMEETFTDTISESSVTDNLKIILTVLAPVLSGLLPGIMDAF